MKYIVTAIFACTLALAFPLSLLSYAVQPINAVLGDVSFFKAFGSKPTVQTNEQLRIRTHLAYVEELLRQGSTAHLSAVQCKKRAFLLERLHEYRLAGRFPKNLDYPHERRPCFIDTFGSICAVGYLIEQDAGGGLAELINSKHKYDYLSDMKTLELLNWVEQSGLTIHECAMIQPGYETLIPDDSFVILDVKPNMTTASTQAFHITLVADGIPTTATLFTNSFLTGSIYANLTRPLPPRLPGDFRYSDEAVERLPLVKYTLSPSNRFGGRSQGTLIFQAYGNGLPSALYKVFVRYGAPIRGLGIYYQDVYQSQVPAIFTVSSTPSSVTATGEYNSSTFPNPVVDRLYIRSGSSASNIRIVSAQGSEVCSEVIQGKEVRTIDVAHLPAGVYFIEITQSRERSVQKFIKQ
jgi:hypothetical protein